MRDVSLGVQLKNFTQTLSRHVTYPLETPTSWIDAFAMLERYLTSQLSQVARKVVFLDEIPWIASPRSGFLSAHRHSPGRAGAIAGASCSAEAHSQNEGVPETRDEHGAADCTDRPPRRRGAS
jgi:hypothetical protein